MAPNLQARMGLFPATTKEFVNQPGDTIDPQAEFGDRFPKDLTEIATVCWSTNPSLGMPVAPALVSSTDAPFGISGDTTSLNFLEVDAQTAYEVNLVSHLPQPPLDGIFCVLARGDAPDACEIVAIDALGDEIPETRQKVEQGSKLIFFGPGIYGVRASGRVELQDVRLIAFTSLEYPLVAVAEVGPCLPGIGCYDDQAYLGVRLNQSDALATRLKADALARANTRAPHSNRLTSDVHRKDPTDTASRLLQQNFVTEVPPNFTAILADAAWTYQEPVTGTPGASFEVCPAAMWQAISLMGPVEAATLGMAVSFPVAQFPYLETNEQIFDWIMKQGTLPFPMVRIATYHALLGFVDTGNANDNRRAPNVVTSTQFARLFVAADPALIAEPALATPPKTRDGPASCDVRLFVGDLSRLDAFFVEDGPSSENFFEDDDANGGIKIFFPNTDESDAASLGRPYFVVGPFSLPFTASVDKQLGAQARDIFGRWPSEGTPKCTLDPWPVKAPVFGPTSIDYPIDGLTILSTTIMWDWALRTPRDFRLGLVVTDDSKDQALTSSLPAAGLQFPGEPSARHISIVFDAAGVPSLQGGAPSGMKIAEIDPPPPDPDVPVVPAAINDPDPHTYALIVPIGENSELFNAQPTRFVALTADAWEVVSGTTEARRSKGKARTISQLNDPRPPILESSHWGLNWASRPNGANIARAYLKGPSVTAGATDLLGYTAWRASETAVLDLALANEDPDTAASLADAVRREPNMQIRLRLVQNIVGPQLNDPAFTKQFVGLFLAANTTLVERGYEVDVPGTQPGLEFAMFTATSHSGMMSAKFDETGLANLYAIAVPVPRKVSQPALKILTHDPAGLLELSGLCIAIVGFDRQGAQRGIRFFWDANPDIASPDELLHRLDPIAELGVQDALRYVDNIRAIIERMPFPEVRIFMLQPPQSWMPHCFSVDTVGLDPIGQDPNHDVASRRSNLVTIAMVPNSRPSLVAGKPPTNGRTWTVTPSGLFERAVPGYTDCQIMMSSLDDQRNEVDRVGPVLYADFIKSGLNLPSAHASATYVNGAIEVTIDATSPVKLIRLSAKDAANREASVVLPTVW